MVLCNSEAASTQFILCSVLAPFSGALRLCCWRFRGDSASRRHLARPPDIPTSFRFILLLFPWHPSLGFPELHALVRPRFLYFYDTLCAASLFFLPFDGRSLLGLGMSHSSLAAARLLLSSGPPDKQRFTFPQPVFPPSFF